MDKNAIKGVELRGDKRVEDSGLHRSEEKSDCFGNYAYLATGAHNVRDGLASRIPRTNPEGTESTLGKDDLRSCLGECGLPVNGTVDQSHHSFSGEFLSRHGAAYERGGETNSKGVRNLDGRDIYNID
ncbi:hypothetical protein AXG93_3052s1090 [Marchantia polymorpha subsp. ruderalis]|uniref:Uncharacterized protein n=1 Tax=Marchantia polymorpha subsp. ruderalis TaxID=1480154 RepID=A0A176WIK2_MARPO|nr:hypothetical protein AXG93_3052s1090 [Marchantia polymorpha subsp. ruderalis]